MQNRTSKPAVRNHRKAILLGSISLLLVFSIIFVSVNYQTIKYALLRRLLSPTAYITLLEKEYLSEQSEALQKKLALAGNSLSAQALTGLDVTLSVSRLISAYLPGKFKDLEAASLSVRHQLQESGFSLSGILSANAEERLHIKLWTDADKELFYLQAPELFEATHCIPYSDHFLPVYLLQKAATFLHACISSAYEQIQADPYAYLLPYLDIVEHAALEPDYIITLEDTDLTVDRLTASISLDKALEIVSGQLEEMQETNPLLPVWHLLSGLFEELAASQTATLNITAYADTTGHILGHEFAIELDSKPFCSLTGILSNDLLQGRNGTLYFSYFDNTSEETITIPIELQQFGISAETGFLTGTLLLTPPMLSGISFTLDFYERNQLPEAELRVRALGFTGASVHLLLSTEAAELSAP